MGVCGQDDSACICPCTPGLWGSMHKYDDFSLSCNVACVESRLIQCCLAYAFFGGVFKGPLRIVDVVPENTNGER